MNKNIKDFASKGGKNRWIGISPQVRSQIARKAIKARWAKHKLVSEYELIPERNYRKDYYILAQFIESKGSDPEEILEMAKEADF